MKIYAFIITAIALILGFLLWDQSTTSSVRSKVLESEISAHKKAKDSLEVVYKLRIADDSVILLQYGESIQRANRSEQRALKLEIALKNEIRHNRTFTDSVTDSLLSAIR